MKKLIQIFTLFFIFTLTDSFCQNVNVTPSFATYPTLKAAFDSINVGKHTGNISVSIIGNTTETASAVLNDSGSGGSSYTSITITPSGGVRTVEGNINGAVIKINYADNITIDGRINGEGRNLIIKNNNAGFEYTAGVWIASSGFGTMKGARHNTVRNCEISCGLSQLSSSLTTYGIIQGGTSTNLFGFGGSNNDSNYYMDNKITKCKIGIALLAYVTNLNKNNVISGNIIGSSSYNSDIIGKTGIYTQVQQFCEISNNEVKFIGGPRTVYGFGTDLIGIAAELYNWDNSFVPSSTGGNYSILNNKIHDIKQEEGFSVAGIVMSATYSGPPTNNLIANNEIYNLICNGNTGRQLAGIGKINGYNDKIIFNSIYLTGDADPAGTASASDTCGGGILLRSTNTWDSVTLIANNTIYMDITQNRDSIRTKSKYCIVAPQAGYVWGNGGIKNNNYYFPASNLKMKTGGAGISSGITAYTTLTNWKTAYSPSQDAFSIQSNPLYSLTSPYYLMPSSSGSPLILGGTPVSGMTSDILSISRNATKPTIGAYENDTTINSKLNVNFTGFIQGFYNSGTNSLVSDTIKAFLRNATSPYNKVDSSTKILNSDGTSFIAFNNAPTGTYYIVFTHRNSIETWSKSGGQSLTRGAINNYQFSDLSSKAYGNNIIQIDASPVRFGFYGGDVIKDGIVDASDVSSVDNAANASLSGYVITDVTGDNFVDAQDQSITDNNSFSSVQLQRP